jgi:hypothetical protein
MEDHIRLCRSGKVVMQWEVSDNLIMIITTVNMQQTHSPFSNLLYDFSSPSADVAFGCLASLLIGHHCSLWLVNPKGGRSLSWLNPRTYWSELSVMCDGVYDSLADLSYLIAEHMSENIDH